MVCRIRELRKTGFSVAYVRSRIARRSRFQGSGRVGQTFYGSGSFGEYIRAEGQGEEDATSIFRKGVAGDWRNVFTEVDKRVSKEVAGNLLIVLDYEKEHDW